MKDEHGNRKFNLIISSIGLSISLICLILEIVLMKKSIAFWITLTICNLCILLGNLIRKKE